MSNRTARLLGGGLLALASTASPRGGAASAFPALPPGTAFVPNGRIRTARAAFGGPTSAAAPAATRLAGGLSDLNSLRDVAANPHLFPTTSGYVRALSEAGAGSAAAPSAEEFLAQLSAEVRRASRTESQVEAPSLVSGEAAASAAAMQSSSSSSSSSSFLYNVAESNLPSAVSVVGVAAAAAAARGYDPASCAGAASWLASANGHGMVNGMGNGGGMEGPALAYVTASANAASDIGSSTAGHGDHAAGYASAASTAASTTTSTGGGGASESFASWHSQGGSNSLKDLASSIPVVDQQDTGYAAQDGVAGEMNEYYSTMQGMSGVNHDYFGRDGFHMVDNTVTDAGVQQVTPAMQVFVDGTSANLGTPPPLPSDYLSMDATPLQLEVDPAFAPHVGNQLSGSLSFQLADGLGGADGHSATEALPSSPKLPLLGDYIKTKLEQVDLPKLSIQDKLDKVELPKISNPFSEVQLPKVSIKDKLDDVDMPRVSNPFSELHLPKAPSSLQEAFSSVREALPTAAEVSNSLETLSGQVGRAGTTVKSGASRAVEMSNSFSESFRGHENRVGEAGVSGARALGDAVKAGAARVAELSPPRAMDAGEGMASSTTTPAQAVLPQLNFRVPAMPHVELPHFELPHFELPDFSHPPSLPNVGDASLSDFGNGVIHSVQFIGGILVKFADLILDAVAGTSVASLLSDVQTSMTSTINVAIHAVVSTIDNIANMSIKEILQHLMALLFAITDILLKVANAVVYLLSGRDGENWALQASSTVKEASSLLLASATQTYDEVTHVSIAQLAHNIGDYSHHVGNEFLVLVSNLNAAADGVASSLDADALDKVATAVQTALTL